MAKIERKERMPEEARSAIMEARRGLESHEASELQSFEGGAQRRGGLESHETSGAEGYGYID